MYTPHPLPTLNPNNWYNMSPWYGVVDQVWNKILLMLDSVPVVPNFRGLYDPSTGEWIAPVVSALDIIIAVFIMSTFVGMLLRLSGGDGLLSSLLRLGGSRHEK